MRLRSVVLGAAVALAALSPAAATDGAGEPATRGRRTPPRPRSASTRSARRRRRRPPRRRPLLRSTGAVTAAGERADRGTAAAAPRPAEADRARLTPRRRRHT